jgi:dihydrofolate reductase
VITDMTAPHVVIDISVSLDGYVAGPDRTADEPLGRGGERLHDWMADPTGQDVLGRAVGDLGAVICGRRTYDDSVRWWQADGPSGPARRPVVVVTHEPPDEVPAGGVYQFASGIDAALDIATEAADGATVCVMGGGNLIGQFLTAGLVDEVSLHLVPVLLGSGVSLTDAGLPRALELEPIDVVSSPSAEHRRYRVGGRR